MMNYMDFTKSSLTHKDSRVGYSRLSEGDEASLSSDIQPTSRWQRKGGGRLPWIIAICSAILNALLIGGIIIARQDSPRHHGLGTFETGFKTDFADAGKHIEIVKTVFNGSPEFKDDGTMYIPNPDPVRYVGDPKEFPEIDENWENLVYGRYFRITEKEAYDAFGDDYREYWDDQFGAYLTGIDMFHTLHCINHLRRAYYPHIYKEGYKSPEKALMHRDHCLEQLRQYVMCHGDLTPIPTKYFKALDRNYVLSDVPHVCRNFDKLQAWMMDRYHGPTAVPRYNRTT